LDYSKLFWCKLALQKQNPPFLSEKLQSTCYWDFQKVVTDTTYMYTIMNQVKVKVKVKCSRYKPSVAQRVGRGTALLFHDRGTRRGEWSAACPGRTLPQERPGTHFTGGWVGLRAHLDRQKISS